MDDIYSQIDYVDKSTSKPSRAFIQELIRNLRKSKIRRPDLVAKYGGEMFRRGSMDGDVWSLAEQVFQAALDVGDKELAEECLDKLKVKFPKSNRVKRLVGMKYEALKDYKHALVTYDAILAENPGNLPVMKRKICVHRAQGNIAEAISELHNVLKFFPGDGNTWTELAEIHLSLSDYAAAAHCYEELVLLNPTCAVTHCRLADIYYTLGGHENFVYARKHYTMSVETQSGGNNLRAIYGMIAACKAVQQTSSSTATAVSSKSSSGSSGANGSKSIEKNDLAVNGALLEWAQEQVGEIVAGGSETVALVQSAIM
jgi:tetratricopeptide (TPR) repeat protein